MIRKSDWPAIDRAINKLIRVHNKDVPDCGRELPVAFAIERDRFRGRIELAAVRFPSGEYVLRRGANVQWKVMR